LFFYNIRFNGEISMKNRIILAALLCAVAFSVCRQSAAVKEPIVKVGRVTLGGEEMEAFEKAARVYPASLPPYFPAQRQPVTFMAECEAIYQRAGSRSAGITKKITASLDWEWKKRYYAALLFMDLLVDNLGYTDKQLEEYYKKSTEEFRVTVRAADGQDSSYIPPFDSVKTRVADRCFYNAHKPDSAFIARQSEQDSLAIMGQWLYAMRSNPNPVDFYLRLFFKERAKEDYADSLEQVFGEGKMLAQADMDVVTSWLPDSRKNMRMIDRAEWLLKWLFFSKRAEELGLTATREFKGIMHWAQRVEFAAEYLRAETVPGLEPAAPHTGLDSALAEMTVYDRIGQAERINPQWLASELSEIARVRLAVKVDSAIYAIRKGAKISFLQTDRPDLRDDKSADPVALIAKADSLREAAADQDISQDEALGLMSEAELIYRSLASNFAFTEHGRRAMGELAKTIIDKYSADPKRYGRYSLSEAISAYRKSQKLDDSLDGLCNSYFMAGFAYDEHIKNYSLAEANYKWILRHAPECNLASDAEFMIQHLDEPMASVEEIQGQSMRQGRVVDFDEGEEETL
jgi:hypothetical protein